MKERLRIDEDKLFKVFVTEARTFKETAKHFKCSVNAIRKRVRRLGFDQHPTRRKNRKGRGCDKRKELPTDFKEDYLNGMSYKELRGKYKTSQRGIYYNLRRYKLKRKDRPEEVSGEEIKTQFLDWLDKAHEAMVAKRKIQEILRTTRENYARVAEVSFPSSELELIVLYYIVKILEIRVHPKKKIGGKTFDFLLPDHNLLIEVDGTLHPKDNDAEFNRVAANFGYSLLRIPSRLIRSTSGKNEEGFIKKIREAINDSTNRW